MDQKILPLGTKMYFGIPAEPMDNILIDAIAQVIAQTPEISEAYLPQCYIDGEQEAKQVLIIGFYKKKHIPQFMPELLNKLALVLPPKLFIDVIPFTMQDMPQETRIKECQIFEAKINEHQDIIKPWWQFW